MIFFSIVHSLIKSLKFCSKYLETFSEHDKFYDLHGESLFKILKVILEVLAF